MVGLAPTLSELVDRSLDGQPIALPDQEPDQPCHKA